MINLYRLVNTEFAKETINNFEPKENIDFKEIRLKINDGRHELKLHKNTVFKRSVQRNKAIKLQAPKPLKANPTATAPDINEADKLTLSCVLKSRFLFNNVRCTKPNALKIKINERTRLIRIN